MYRFVMQDAASASVVGMVDRFSNDALFRSYRGFIWVLVFDQLDVATCVFPNQTLTWTR